MRCTLAEVYRGELYRVEVSEAVEIRFRALKIQFRKTHPAMTTGRMLAEIAQGLKFGQDLTEADVIAYLDRHTPVPDTQARRSE